MKRSDNIVFADSPDGAKNNDTYYDVESQWGKQKTSIVLSRIPFKINKIADNSSYIHIPEWFKSRACWWSEDMVWNNQEFINGAKFLLTNNTGDK